MIIDQVLADAAHFNAAFLSRTEDTGTAKHLKLSLEDGLTAHAGGGQASAYAITKDVSRFSTVASHNDSAKLPVSVAGYHLYIVNDGSKILSVYPATGEQIDGLAANTAVTLLPEQTGFFLCRTAGQWRKLFPDSTLVNVVSGSYASPNLIAASGVIPIVAGALKQTVYVAGNGAAVTTGGAHITAGTIDGQELDIYGCHATNTVTVTDGDGTGTEGNGDMVHGARSITTWKWDGTRWTLKGTNGL